MESSSREGKPAASDEWQLIVEAAWALNHISVGLKGIMPRLLSAKHFLDELEAIAPSVDNQAMLDIAERELRAMSNEFRKVSEQLDTRSGEIQNILALIDARRAQLRQR